MSITSIANQASNGYLRYDRPDVRFHCNMNWDPFWYMIDNNKTYGTYLLLLLLVFLRFLCPCHVCVLALFDYHSTPLHSHSLVFLRCSLAATH
jgi:hypothetical protein